MSAVAQKYSCERCPSFGLQAESWNPACRLRAGAEFVPAALLFLHVSQKKQRDIVKKKNCIRFTD
jgi:hypothetical protein